MAKARVSKINFFIEIVFEGSVCTNIGKENEGLSSGFLQEKEMRFSPYKLNYRIAFFQDDFSGRKISKVLPGR